MSQVTRGPLPASVYRRRRLAVLLAVCTVVALVVGLARLVTGGGDGAGQVALSGSGTSAAVPTETVTVVADGSGRDREAKGKPRRDREAALPQPNGPCTDEDVVVRPDVSDAVAGREVVVELTLSTKLAEACTWELSPDTFAWKVTSGEDEIWTSRECPRAVPTRELVVRRDTDTTTRLTWGGKRSDADCSRFTEWALPGYYHVTVAPLAGEPRDVQFELGAPVGAVVTAAPEPRRKKR